MKPSTDPTGDDRRASGQRGIVVFLFCTTLLLTARLAWLVHRYAVDVLYWDQWDIRSGLFTKTGLWSQWRFQFGPQRQGLGAWVIALSAWATDWNARADAFVGLFIVVLAALVALAIARSLRGRWSASDCLIPAVLLSTTMVPVLTGVPNPSHGPLPLLLGLTLGYFALAKDERVRVTGVAASAALCAQTGFTWIMTVVTVPFLVLLLVAAIRTSRHRALHAFALSLVVASLALLFYGFQHQPAVECFRFPDPKPWRYVAFAGAMILRAGQFVEAPPRVLGTLAALGALGLLAWGGWVMAKTSCRDRLASLVYLLAGFSLAFAFNTAVGRLCLGLEAAAATRYIPYALPLLLAAYLCISLSPRLHRFRTSILVFCVALAVLKETVLARTASAEADHHARIKASFRDCYLSGKSVEACQSQWLIHPNPSSSGLQERLDYLRDHRLSFFRSEAK